MVHHRPRPLYLLRRDGALGPHAEPHSSEAGPADLTAGLRAIHRRSSPEGHGSPVHSAARPDRRVAPRADSGGAAHGGKHREAAVAGTDRQIHGSIASSNRAPVQARFELLTPPLLPPDSPATPAPPAAPD